MVAEIAKTDGDSLVREAAVKTLTDQGVLAAIAKTDVAYLVRQAAAENLTDQALLTEIAKTDGDRDVRRTAVRKLTDHAVLADIAKTDDYSRVRETAVDKLTDQALLTEIAKTDSDRDVRWTAVRKLTDQAVLAAIAKNDPNGEVRQAAARKLTDQAVLADVAKTDSDHNVRAAAGERLTDQAVLAEIAKADPVQWVRQAAARKLTDQGVLIAKTESDRSAREILPPKVQEAQAAMLAVMPHLTDQAQLAKIAQETPAYAVRRAAVYRLTDQALLTEIAKTDSDPTVRAAANQRLHAVTHGGGETPAKLSLKQSWRTKGALYWGPGAPMIGIDVDGTGYGTDHGTVLELPAGPHTVTITPRGVKMRNLSYEHVSGNVSMTTTWNSHYGPGPEAQLSFTAEAAAQYEFKYEKGREKKGVQRMDVSIRRKGAVVAQGSIEWVSCSNPEASTDIRCLQPVLDLR